jgi:hypothetical protein
MEWFGNGGGMRITQLYGDILHWYYGMLMNPDQRLWFSQEFNVDPATFLNPITLQAGQSKTFYIPILIPGSDERSPFPLGMLNNYLVLRLTSKMALESGTAANLTVSSFYLWLQHVTYPEDEHAQIDKLFKENGVERKVITNYNMQQIQTVTAQTGITPIILSQFGNIDVKMFHFCLTKSGWCDAYVFEK